MLDALSPTIKEVAKALLYVGIAIDLLTLAIGGLSGLDLAGVLKGGGTVGALITLFGVFGILIKSIPDEKRIKAFGNALVQMSASFLLLYLAIALLGALSVTQVTQGTIAIGAVMTLFGVVMRLSKGSAMNIPTLLLFDAAIGVLVTALTLISLLDWQKTIGAATALGIVLLAMGG